MVFGATSTNYMAARKRHVSSTAQDPPGRPPTHAKKAGGLKRSSTTPDKAVYEAGLSFTYRYYNLDSDVDVVESLNVVVVDSISFTTWMSVR